MNELPKQLVSTQVNLTLMESLISYIKSISYLTEVP